MRRVLVTGGSRGIGWAICEKFRQEGYEVVSPTRQELDLAQLASIERFLSEVKDRPFDVIINNAGINPIDYLENIKDDEFDATVQISIRAPYKLIKGLVQGMRENRYGRIINISSVWSIVAKEKRMTYSVCKTGLNGLTRALAVELAPYRILVNSISPGFVNTELTKQNLSQQDADEIARQIPLARFAEPQEIAEVVYFIGSEKNTYITGQNIVVDGGYVSK